MPRHKHAELMAEYSKDAMETETPWKLWEFKSQAHPCIYKEMSDHPAWYLHIEYRRKPCTIRIGSFDVPEPMREAPEIYTVIFLPIFYNESSTTFVVWNGSGNQIEWLERGLCHSTREAAEIHAKALISLTEKK